MSRDIAAYWREWGAQNGREALLLHCGNAHSGAWKGLAQHLDDALHLVATDHPGHGRSPAWDASRDLHDQATEYARGALLSLGAADGGNPPKVNLIGHSFGATVALRLALENPESVRSLTLIEPVLFAALRGTDAWQISMDSAAPMDRLIKAGRREEAAERFTNLWGNGQTWAALPEAQRSYITRCIHLIPASWPEIYFDTAGLLAPGRLESLTCPTLLMRGENSPDDIARIHKSLAPRLGAEDLILPDSGHMLPITHPEAVAKRIRAFLAL